MCGCADKANHEQQIRTAMVMAYFSGADLDRPIGDQRQIRYMPDEDGYVRWLGVRWVGVPKPVRWIFASWTLRGFFGLPTITGELYGCGCIAALRDTWDRIWRCRVRIMSIVALPLILLSMLSCRTSGVSDHAIRAMTITAATMVVIDQTDQVFDLDVEDPSAPAELDRLADDIEFLLSVLPAGHPSTGSLGEMLATLRSVGESVVEIRAIIEDRDGRLRAIRDSLSAGDLP